MVRESPTLSAKKSNNAGRVLTRPILLPALGGIPPGGWPIAISLLTLSHSFGRRGCDSAHRAARRAESSHSLRHHGVKCPNTLKNKAFRPQNQTTVPC